jgi:hypothetical protein
MILVLGCVLVIASTVLGIIVVQRSFKALGESGRWMAGIHQTPSREFVPAGSGGGQGSSWLYMTLELRKVELIRSPDPPPGFPAPTVRGVGRNSCCYFTVPEHHRSPLADEAPRGSKPPSDTPCREFVPAGVGGLPEPREHRRERW